MAPDRLAAALARPAASSSHAAGKAAGRRQTVGLVTRTAVSDGHSRHAGGRRCHCIAAGMPAAHCLPTAAADGTARCHCAVGMAALCCLDPDSRIVAARLQTAAAGDAVTAAAAAAMQLGVQQLWGCRTSGVQGLDHVRRRHHGHGLQSSQQILCRCEIAYNDMSADRQAR